MELIADRNVVDDNSESGFEERVCQHCRPERALSKLSKRLAPWFGRFGPHSTRDDHSLYEVGFDVNSAREAFRQCSSNGAFAGALNTRNQENCSFSFQC
jgi:hypothetical protein